MTSASLLSDASVVAMVAAALWAGMTMQTALNYEPRACAL